MSTSTYAIKGFVAYYAALYGVSGSEMLKTLMCESNLNPRAIGDKGTSYGIAQIHLPAHEDVTKEEAFDPEFSIRWMAEQFSLGNQRAWTCWRDHVNVVP